MGVQEAVPPSKLGRKVECAGLWCDIPDDGIEEIEEGMKELRESISLSRKSEEG